MIAEGGHTRPADGGPAVLDEVEHVVVREGRHCLPVPKIAGPDEKEGGAPGAMAIGPVARGAVAQIRALDGRGVLGHGMRQEEEGEDAATHEEKTGRQDDEQPFRSHCWRIARREAELSAAGARERWPLSL